MEVEVEIKEENQGQIEQENKIEEKKEENNQNEGIKNEGTDDGNQENMIVLEDSMELKKEFDVKQVN